ncbi:MAG: peptidoglycan DD-metalloendopeptidase family protein [Sedimentibacter sp.]
MKNNRLNNAKTKMKNFFIRLRHKDTSFFIIALCIVLLATAIVWRYSSNPDLGGENNLAENNAEEENKGAVLDPYEDYVEGIIEDYENANKDNEEEKTNTIDLKSMKTPLAGEIYREFTMDDLVYYESIGEWRVHKGVDIKPKDTLLIESALAGTVESINTSELTGTEIVIDHGNNIKTLYSNLVSSSVKVGDHVKQGQAIGNVGKTVSIEASDGAHLHFELLVDGKNVNPLDYIN